MSRNLGQAKGVAERNEVGGLLGRHDARDPRHADDVALLGVAGENRSQRRRSHPHPPLGDRDPVRRRLVRDVDHPRFAISANMGQRLRLVCG
jgi:hypothetical protein